MLEREDFILLLNKHQKIVHKVCSLYLKEAADREDLFQEIVLQAWKSYATFKGNSQFSTWLYRVALNTAITFSKKNKITSKEIDLETLSETSETFNPIEEQTQAMYKAIENLSKIEKALVMLYLDDYNYNDIGEILGTTPNNVAVKMLRVKEKLKNLTQQHYQL